MPARGREAPLAAAFLRPRELDMNDDLKIQTGRDARRAIRSGAWSGPTAGVAPGYAQANLVIVERGEAYDFLRFCARNPKPCPVLDVLDAGSPIPDPYWAEDADLRRDLSGFRIYENGRLVDECRDLSGRWRENWVAFLTGCSFSFEWALISAGLSMRHIEMGRNVPMFSTKHDCRPAGRFHGPLVVSMRPIPNQSVALAVEITSHYPLAHGAPVHIGDPAALGIVDLEKPDFGDPVPVKEGESPVFWACGVTPQAVAVASGLDYMITHIPGHMFITDRRVEELVDGQPLRRFG
jgi:uncharacterized protein YcsI (UPF0317 family)